MVRFCTVSSPEVTLVERKALAQTERFERNRPRLKREPDLIRFDQFVESGSPSLKLRRDESARRVLLLSAPANDLHDALDREALFLS